MTQWLCESLSQWPSDAIHGYNHLNMRQCEIKVINLCQVRTKLIALGWYRATRIFWCQTNPEIHCSPAMNNVWNKKYLFYELMKASWQFFICSFMEKFFLITCVCSCISLKTRRCRSCWWHMTHDIWQRVGVNILLKFQLSSSYGLRYTVFNRHGVAGAVYKHLCH